MKFTPPQTYTGDEIPNVFGGDRFSVDVSRVKDSFTDFLNMAEFLKTTTLTCKTCSEFPCHRNQDPGQKIGFCYEVAPKSNDIPTITPEMAEETNIEIAKRRAGRRGSPLKSVTDAPCTVCGSRSVCFADDLVFDVVLTGERILIQNLSGIRCSNCGDFAFDADSSKIIDKRTGNSLVP